MRVALFTATMVTLAAPAMARPAPVALAAFNLDDTHIRLAVSINGRPATALLDTGLNPSGVALASAERLGLAVDRAKAAPVRGYGAAAVSAYETSITNLRFGGVIFPAMRALADDGPAYAGNGQIRPFDAMLGYSFLSGKIVLIDYVAGEVAILPDPRRAAPFVKGCQAHLSTPMFDRPGATIPSIPDFALGELRGAFKVDTGAGAMSLFKPARSDELAALMAGAAQSEATGARGRLAVQRFVLPWRAGFGPFSAASLPAVYQDRDAPTGSDAVIIGNAFFKAAGMKVMFNYRTRQADYYGSCPRRAR